MATQSTANDFSFTPDGKTCSILFITSFPDYHFKEFPEDRLHKCVLNNYDTENWKLISTQSLPDNTYHIFYSPDGKHLFTLSTPPYAQDYPKYSLHVFDTVTHKQLQVLDYNFPRQLDGFSVGIDRLSRLFISTPVGIDVYDYHSGYSKMPDQRISLKHENRQSILTPDGRFIAVGSYGRLVIYKTLDWTKVADLEHIWGAKNVDLQFVVGGSVSESGDYLVASMPIGPLRIFRTDNWMQIDAKFKPTISKYLGGVCFSPDNKMLIISGENEMRFYDIASGQETKSFSHIASGHIEICPGKNIIGILDFELGTVTFIRD